MLPVCGDQVENGDCYCRSLPIRDTSTAPLASLGWYFTGGALVRNFQYYSYVGSLLESEVWRAAIVA